MIIDLVVGARPNLVKAAAIQEACKGFPQVELRTIHTGQHAGALSDPFVAEFDLKISHTFSALDSPATSPVDRLGWTIVNLSEIFRGDRPDYVMVVGDTDSTLAGALAAAKMGIPVVHVEAGLRCGDSKMQEEINRKIVDHASTICYATSTDAWHNLRKEGIEGVTVGNVMVDTLLRFKSQLLEQASKQDHLGRFALLTLHRAENVDDPKKLKSILDAVAQLSERIPVIFPAHPRVKIETFLKNIIVYPPLGYVKFGSLMICADFVMTDSGGVQEETTALGVPCLTLRDKTERPETVYYGTNSILGTDPKNIAEADSLYFPAWQKCPDCPPLWDGHAAERILADLVKRK